MDYAVPVGHYSQLGEQAIQKMTEDSNEYSRFLKFFGRVFKHPLSVALEFYVNKPDAQFIASQNQWKNANYHVIQGSKGIQFLDKGKITTLYDFEDVVEEYPPTRWTITQSNVNAIRKELRLSSDKPLFVALDESASSIMDDLSLIQELGFTNLTDSDKLKFRDSYHNMIQTMIVGRLEINGAKYSIQPDNFALSLCQDNEQRLLLLTNASASARKSLASVEYAFDTLRTENSIIRKEKENELHRMENAQSGTENDSRANGISSDSNRTTLERDNGNTHRDSGQSDRLDVNSDDSSAGRTEEVVSRDNDREVDSRDSDNQSAVSVQPDERTLRADDSERSNNGGRADRTVRQDVDEEYGEELPRESRTSSDETQISDSSKVGGQESGGILGTAERQIRQESRESSPDENLREDSKVGGNEEIHDRPLDNDGNSSAPVYGSITSQSQSYNTYRAGLPETRFTSLTEQQKFNYYYHPHVEKPEYSIWGEIDHCYRINNGIYDVNTSSHGGIMVKSDIARNILSSNAQKYAYKEKGWYYYEEDCDAAVVLRELLDKGLFSDIDDYFDTNYNKDTSDIFPHYNNVINNSIKKLNSTYAEAREMAIFKALPPESQNESLGQMSFDIDTNINDNTISENTFEIYQLKSGEVLHNHRFTDYSTLIESGKTVSFANYEKVYEDTLSNGTSLEDIYSRFNINIPTDFKGHSLSVSDIVVTHEDDITKAFYVDSFGYKEVPEFFNNPKPDIVADFRNKTDSLFNKINGYSAEDIENMISKDIDTKLAENNIKAEIGRVILSGSRCRGLEYASDDIDLLVEVESELDEESLTDIFNDQYSESIDDPYGYATKINGFKVYIHPIRKEESGTLDTVLPLVEANLNKNAVTNKKLNFYTHRISLDLSKINSITCSELNTSPVEYSISYNKVTKRTDELTFFNLNAEQLMDEIELFLDNSSSENKSVMEVKYKDGNITTFNAKESKVAFDKVEINDDRIEYNYEFEYRLLSRLQQDCKYFLGNGNGHEKHLWAGNVDDQIEKMYELYDKFPEKAKPEWLTREEIDNYAEKMRSMINSKNIVDTNSNELSVDDIEKANINALNSVEVGDILKLNEDGDLLYFRADNISGNFMISMTRVNEDGSDYTDIGTATKSLVGNWKETFLRENKNNLILHIPASTVNDNKKVSAEAESAEITEETIKSNNRPHRKPTTPEILYKEFVEAFPEIANGSHTFERYGDSYVEGGNNSALEPLSIENLGGDAYSFMYWYIQNGDLMRDPDYVFTLDNEKKELNVFEYQIDGIAPVGTIYESVIADDDSIDLRLQKTLNEGFLETLRNAIVEKELRQLKAYTEADGTYIESENAESKDTENDVEADVPVIDDKSAVYREILNDFSEKHNLGELNIVTHSYGFYVKEKYADEESEVIWNIQRYRPDKPLSIDELSKELTSFENTTEQNNSTVSEYGERLEYIEFHGGTTEIPAVQDNLPDITYADNPFEKVRDNITAIREMIRLEKIENNNLNAKDESEKIESFSSIRNNYHSYDSCMERLRKYSGWGGVPQLFDESYSVYNYMRKELEELLTPEEFASVRASTLNSHYTPQVIIDSMYKTIQNMGISEDSRVLEPACGTGNFISRMPSNIGNGGIVGVELDSITARIAKQLNKPNPHSENLDTESRDITILNTGFEKSGLENNSFDLVIGNVPFGEYKMNDPDYTKDWLIHDAFFRKALDKVAVGGVVAFITSSGTMDKKNSTVREYLASRAELIGALRLPNNAFKDAGTNVTSDIIFLQKRKEPLKPFEPKPDWCYTTPVEVEMVGKKYEGEKRTAHINSYFAKNPQMVLGTMKQTTYYDRLTCEPNVDKTLEEQLTSAFRNLNAKISIEKREKSNLEKKGKIEPWGKSFTYQVKDDKVYFNTGNSMEEITGSKKVIDRLKALCEMRNTLRELLDKQITEAFDTNLIPLRNKLNELYDDFVEKYGNVSSKSVRKAFAKDADYPILSALEYTDSETKKIMKADILSERTVYPVREISSVQTAEEAMQISLDKKGKLDIPYMAMLLKEKYADKELSEIMEIVTDELLEKELVYKDPEKTILGKPYSGIVDKSEYLCGNVRRKLVMAEDSAKQDSSFNKNVEALKKVIPEEIGATEIIVDLGCAWIDTEDYEDFMRGLSGRNKSNSRKFTINYSSELGRFTIDGSKTRNIDGFNTNEISTYGTEDMNLYHILENLLNQKKIQVFDYNIDPISKKKKQTINKNKTQIANSKAKEIKKKFNEWIFATEERKEKYVKRYNEKFNNLVGRSYDGSHLTFTGMKNTFELRPHQLDCVARTIYGGNTLVAHCVGAGKSAVIASSVMKKKELGLINKACVVVPKSLTEQTEREWRTSFPDAKLLVVDNKELSNEDKRELFTARVATGNYDAIIMSREQFEKLSMSDEYKLEYLKKYKAEKIDLLRQLRAESGRKLSIIDVENVIKTTDEEIEAITNPKSKTKGKDKLIEFEKLGFDYLVVDEAHAYKNGSVSTKMGDVSGVSTKQSGRSADMKMKCDFFNEEFGNGHILFATGTPVSNSMTELYVMTRYLRPDLLKDCGCSRFDDWVATFGQIKTQNKKTATGELKLKTCFAGFKNRPELMKMYKEFADLKTIDKLDYLNPPKVKGGKPQVVEVEATPEQREIVKDFARRGRAIQSGKVSPKEDNLLKITSEARIVGLGNEAVASIYEKNGWNLPVGFLKDDKTGKIDECIKNVVEIYNKRYDSKGVQIIFSDIAVNDDNGNFSAYEYIKDELKKQGIPEEEIIFAPKSDSKNRKDIFADINEAKYRVVIASTETLGTGANIQKNLYALHHLDIPWRPADFSQREGRIIRQGNLNDEVEIFNYVTKGTLDSYLYQGVTDKARGIAQLWNDTCISRTAEDIDEKVLTFGELEAAAEGNPKLREYSELKNKIDELEVTRAEYNRETTRIEKSMKELPTRIEVTEHLLKQAKNDLAYSESLQTGGKVESISLKTHNGLTLTSRGDVNTYLASLINKRIDNPRVETDVFQIGKFEISVKSSKDIARPVFSIKGERSVEYRIDVGVGISSDNHKRLINFLETGITRQIEKDTQALEKYTLDLSQSAERIKAPFPNETEYKETIEKFKKLETELTVGGFLDNGEEFASVEDFADFEIEQSDETNDNTEYDKDDLTADEYNAMM